MKVVAITRGGQGLGRATAFHFAKAGYAVSIVGHSGVVTGQNLTVDGGMTVKMIYAE